MGRDHRRRSCSFFGIVSLVAVILLSPCLGSSAAPAEPAAPSPQDRAPLPSTQRERIEARLAQIPVSVTGPPEALLRIGRDQFTVSVGGRDVPDFILDRLCPQAGASAEVSSVERRPIAFLFFLDLSQLTLQGRDSAFRAVRELIPTFLGEGNSGMIVASSSQGFLVEWPSRDAGALLSALDRFAAQLAQPDIGPASEQQRVLETRQAADRARQELSQQLSVTRGRLEEQWEKNSVGNPQRNPMDDPTYQQIQAVTEGTRQAIVGQLVGKIRDYQREEHRRAERSLEMLYAALAAFMDIDAQKVALYFADTLRQEPGRHYFQLFNELDSGKVLAGGPGGDRGLVSAEPWDVRGLFDQAINQATGEGVRVYTVQAEGLAESSPHVRDAQGALAALALETGGRAFLNGIATQKVAQQILEDLSCTFLVSFEPSGFPEDKPLPVSISLKIPKVRTRAPGVIVIRSEAARRTSRLLAAMLRPQSPPEAMLMTGSLIPTGYHDGTFSALLQVAVEPNASEAGKWELGASVVARGSVQADFAVSLVKSQGHFPLVVEREIRIPPGPHTVVSVSRDEGTDSVASVRNESSFPDPTREPAALTTPVVVQPISGAFVREDQTKQSGLMVFQDGKLLRGDVATAFITLVCADKKQREGLRVKRRLLGETEVPLASLPAPDLSNEPCVQLRDVVKPNTLGPGYYLYEIKLINGEKELARDERRFGVAEPSSSEAL